jgi:hypothetical protein
MSGASQYNKFGQRSPMLDALRAQSVLQASSANGGGAGASAVILVDTEANLMLLTPAAGTLGLASDTLYLYVYSGTGWVGTPISLGNVTEAVDIGALRYRDDSGYGPEDISNKTLHTIRLGSYNTAIYPAVEGALRYDLTNKYAEVYQNAAWRVIQALSSAESDDLVKWSDYDTYTVDGYGNPIIDDNGQMSIGALAVECIHDGGTL